MEVRTKVKALSEVLTFANIPFVDISKAFEAGRLSNLEQCDLLIIGSFVMDKKETRTTYNGSSVALAKFVEDGGVLAVLGQANQVSPTERWMPDSRRIERSDRDFSAGFLAQPDHPLLAGSERVHAADLNDWRIPRDATASRTIWEAFTVWSGGTVIVGSGDGPSPQAAGLVEMEWGRGRALFYAIAPDKAFSTGNDTARQAGVKLIRNLVAYPKVIQERRSSALEAGLADASPASASLLPKPINSAKSPSTETAERTAEPAAANAAEVNVGDLKALTDFLEKSTPFSVVGTGPTFTPGRPLCVIVADMDQKDVPSRLSYIEGIALTAEKLQATRVILDEPIIPKSMGAKINEALKKAYGSKSDAEISTESELRATLVRRLPDVRISGGNVDIDNQIDIAVAAELRKRIDELIKAFDGKDGVQIAEAGKVLDPAGGIQMGIHYLNRKHPEFPNPNIGHFSVKTGSNSGRLMPTGLNGFVKAMQPAVDWERSLKFFKRNELLGIELARRYPPAEDSKVVVIFYGADHVIAKPHFSKAPALDKSLQAVLDKNGINSVIVGLKKFRLEELRAAMNPG